MATAVKVAVRRIDILGVLQFAVRHDIGDARLENITSLVEKQVDIVTAALQTAGKGGARER